MEKSTETSTQSPPPPPPSPSLETSSSIPNSNSTQTPNPTQTTQPPQSLLQQHLQHQQQKQMQQLQTLQEPQSQQHHSSSFPQRPQHSIPNPNSSSPFSPPPPSPSPPPPSSVAAAAVASPSVSAPSVQRGGMAIGVPSQQPQHPQRPFSSFGTSSFNQQYGALPPRGPVNAIEPNSQKRAPIQGTQSIGMMGSIGPGSGQMRPSTGPQHRPVQPTMRPSTTPNAQSLSAQKFQGHGMIRASPVSSIPTSSGLTQVSQASTQQQWMSPQGRPHPSSSLPSPNYRPQMRPQGIPQRPQPPQHQIPSTPQQQQSTQSTQIPENYSQQYPPSRLNSVGLQQTTRVSGLTSPKPHPSGPTPSTVFHSGPLTSRNGLETTEDSRKILSKRTIHELVAQIDPSERLDREVEDVLIEIGEDFVESITKVACSLAKHRKSTTLEAKDILLHLERNWHMSLPGFGGEEIRSYKKIVTNDIHKERLAAIKKSTAGTEAGSTKGSAGQIPAISKSLKTPALSSPKA